MANTDGTRITPFYSQKNGVNLGTISSYEEIAPAVAAKAPMLEKSKGAYQVSFASPLGDALPEHVLRSLVERAIRERLGRPVLRYRTAVSRAMARAIAELGDVDTPVHITVTVNPTAWRSDQKGRHEIPVTAEVTG